MTTIFSGTLLLSRWGLDRGRGIGTWVVFRADGNLADEPNHPDRTNSPNKETLKKKP